MLANIKISGSNKRKYGIILVILLIVLVLSVAVFYFIQKKNGSNQKEVESQAISSLDDEKVVTEEMPTAEDVQPDTSSTQNSADKNSDTSDTKKEVTETQSVESSYFLHQNVSTTYFWVGEDANSDNGNISNSPSAWDEDWVKHYGGVDDPKKRQGYFPAKFTPKENPFYFALPYNDFDEKGEHKKDIFQLAAWAKGQKVSGLVSLCKNRWIKIIKGGQAAYAQWEDVGPFLENDVAYVFGMATPKSKTNNHAGLDVSPAVRDFLKLSDIDKTSWQFVDFSQVPEGPWKKVITTSQVYWK
jgi:hypothetical protein